MFSEFASLLFFSRDYAHRAHLRTTSFAQHKALDDFYTGLPDLIDSLIEAYQGRHGLVDIPFVTDAVSSGADIAMPAIVLKQHLDIIEGTRALAIGQDSALQNLVDEIVHLYLSTLYKLRTLV